MPAKAKNYPYEMTKVNSEESKIISKCLIGYMRSFIRCGRHGYVMPGQFKKHAEQIYNFRVRPDDVWIITYPRSGTTWTQELIWLLENNLDFAEAKSTPLYERFPMLETTSHIPEIAFELIKANFMNLGNFQGLDAAARKSSWKTIDQAPSPRYIKTHLPLSMLPPNLLNVAKVIYVARDPRDVAVSYYFLHKMAGKSIIRAKVKDFWEAFRRDLLPCSPIVAHANEAWLQRHHPNLHFVFYEDLSKDLPKEILRMCKFLQREYTAAQLRALADHLSFQNLRRSRAVNNSTDEKQQVQFVRKGEAGGWSQYFDEEMVAQAEQYLSERLANIDIPYPSISVAPYLDEEMMAQAEQYLSERLAHVVIPYPSVSVAPVSETSYL